MNYSFFAMISRMKYIDRWALMRNTEAENLMQHSYEVAVLAHALALKCRWHEEAATAVRSGDKETAANLAADLSATIEAVEALRHVWRKLWESTNKPFGFEVIDFRMGGIEARLDTAAQRLTAFARGEVQDIPELSSESFTFKRRPNNSVSCTNVMDELLGAARQDHPF